MSFTYGFYNSVNHDRVYDALQLSSIFDGIIADGVYETQGQKFMVTASDPASMVVTVGTGRAWFHHTWSLNDSLLPLTIEASDLVLDRIDVVCLEINTNNSVRANSIKVLKGLPDSNPVPPELTHTEYINQYPLAEITIAAGVSSITQSAITNKVGTTDTPFVIGVIDVMDASDLYAQWRSQWNQFIITRENAMDEWVAVQEEEFSEWINGFESSSQAEFIEWFNHMKDQLSEDAAGHLQLEIDDLEAKKQNNEFYVNTTVKATDWVNGVYSFEEVYPSENFDILDIYPNSQTTDAMREAWGAANCSGYEPTNIMKAHGDTPAIDLYMTLAVRFKSSGAYAPGQS